MTSSDSGKRARPPKRDLADLVMPRRPSGVPYAQSDDYDAQALLTANEFSTETEELIVLLDSELGIFQAAAARTLGARNARTAIEALTRLAQNAAIEETARVQAAFALARMQVAGAREILARLLELNPEASPAPLQAASALACLGDPSGFKQVRSALDSQNSLTAMIACKQLFAFAEFDGRPLPGGGVVDMYGAFKRALSRPERNIYGEAVAQLIALDTPPARALLAAN